MKHKMSFRCLLILINTILLLGLSCAIAEILLSLCKKVMYEQSISRIEESLAQITANIDRNINDKIQSSADTLLYDAELRKRIADQHEQKILDVYLIDVHLPILDVENVEGIELAALIRKDGTALCMVDPYDAMGMAQDFADEILARESTNTIGLNYYPLMSNPFSNYSDRVIIVSGAIISPNTGSYIGKQVYTINESLIYEEYRTCEIAQNGEIVITDQQGNLISASNRDYLANETEKQAEEAVRFIPKGGSADTGSAFGICRELNHGRWLLYAIVERQYMNKGLDHIYGFYIPLILLFVMMAIVIWSVLAGWITRPISILVNSMKNVERGDFSQKVEESGQREICMLIRNYNHMIDQIEYSIHTEYELNRAKEKAELDALVAQINPHFLYNTLESMAWKARAAGAPQVAQMAVSLGRMFNLCVNRGRVTHTVEDELDHVRMYMEIQNLRSKNRYDLRIETENPHLLQEPVLKLILQPFVENSILHGFGPDAAPCAILISVKENDENICFTVTDNGAGMPPEMLRSLQASIESASKDRYDTELAQSKHEQGQGIGIRNTHQRIQLYYGPGYGVEFVSRQKTGTSVRILLPKIKPNGDDKYDRL